MTELPFIAGLWEYRIKKSALKLSARSRAALANALASFGAKSGLGKPARYVRSRYGVMMRANWADRTFQYCYYATYGTALVDLLKGVDRPFAFIDIGANQGLYSVIAAQLPLCEQVFALEPVPATFLLLRDNIAANDAAAKVMAIDAALSDRAGAATISTNPAHSGTASLEHTATGQGSASHSVRLIDHRAFDALITWPSALVVKVDVEGHESVVIHELMKSRHAPAIQHLFYEIDQRWTDGEAMIALLRRAGFTSFRKFGVGRHYDMLASR